MDQPLRSMKRLLLCLLPLLASTLFAQTEKFDKAQTGTLPAGWLGTLTGSGTSHWSVEQDPTATSGWNVLMQSGKADFPLCIRTGVKLANGFVEVRFKPVSGTMDQAGGVVWRYQDANNYYVARGNALEDNVCIYRVVNGQRIEFGRFTVTVAPKVWHRLKVEFSGPSYTVYFDGQNVLSASDGTFMQAGAVGVWTKADSVTLFDDFSFGAGRRR